MQFNRVTLKIMEKIKGKNRYFQEAATPLFPAGITPGDDHFLHTKNVIISGDFFPSSEVAFKKNLLERKANLQPHMTTETEILICGKYPDWMLVEKARLYGVKIIFVDKAGELFGRMATNLNKTTPVSLYEEPLGI